MYMDLLDFCKNYWFILIGVLTFIIGWVEIKFQNSDQEKRLSKLESNIEQMNPIFVEIKERLASIEATLKMLIK